MAVLSSASRVFRRIAAPIFPAMAHAQDQQAFRLGDVDHDVGLVGVDAHRSLW